MAYVPPESGNATDQPGHPSQRAYFTAGGIVLGSVLLALAQAVANWELGALPAALQLAIIALVNIAAAAGLFGQQRWAGWVALVIAVLFGITGLVLTGINSFLFGFDLLLPVVLQLASFAGYVGALLLLLVGDTALWKPPVAIVFYVILTFIPGLFSTIQLFAIARGAL